MKEIWLVYCGNKNMRKPIKRVIESRNKVLKLEQWIGRVEIIDEYDNYLFVEVVVGNEKVYEVFRNLNGGRLMMNDGEVLKLSDDERKRYGFDD